MTIVYVALGVTCFLSAANLVAVIFLSNSLFRILVRGEGPVLPRAEPERPQAGLVDPGRNATYDPRFRSSTTHG